MEIAVLYRAEQRFHPSARCRSDDGDLSVASPDAAAFVTNLMRHLPTDRLIVLCQHIPFIGIPGAQTPTAPLTKRDYWTCCAAQVLALSGHTHTQWHSFLGEGERLARRRTPASNGSSARPPGVGGAASPVPRWAAHFHHEDGTPRLRHPCTWTGTDFASRYRVARPAADHQFTSTPRHVVAAERDQPIKSMSTTAAPHHGRLPDSARRPRPKVDTARAPGSMPPTPVAPGNAAPARRHLPGTSLPPPVESQHLWQGRLPQPIRRRLRWRFACATSGASKPSRNTPSKSTPQPCPMAATERITG